MIRIVASAVAIALYLFVAGLTYGYISKRDLAPKYGGPHSGSETTNRVTSALWPLFWPHHLGHRLTR